MTIQSCKHLNNESMKVGLRYGNKIKDEKIRCRIKKRLLQWEETPTKKMPTVMSW